jgi:hypothetical protein
MRWESAAAAGIITRQNQTQRVEKTGSIGAGCLVSALLRYFSSPYLLCLHVARSYIEP